MRSRVTGAALFGLGVIALVFAAGLAFVVGPRVDRLPYDLERTQSVAEAPNATFLQITKGVAEVKQGNLRSTVTVQPDKRETANLEGDLDGEAVVWLVGQEVVNTDNDDLISAYSTALALDRKTGAARTWDGQWLDTGNNRESVDYSGQIYKFPFGTEKKTYEIFDRDINATRPANFVKTEEINGLETYQFTQEISGERQQVPDDRLQVLLSQLLPDAKAGEILYNNTRTVWVEPVTGQFIKVQETQEKTLQGDNGQSTKLLDAVFTYTDDTIARSADTASSNRERLQLVTVWGPLGLLVIGLILIVVALLLTMRRAPGRHARPDEETLDLDHGGMVTASS
jgi:Porin PorA